ncbi:MAG: histidinol-phosphate transaminase, partial [Candidatus Omnitrophica bacterium]|nr:histidinol-phosphate transaminase [Candidatus Omnitrophota bacterium]
LNVKNYVPGKPIEEVEREMGIKSVIKLASNENCFGPSPLAVGAIREALKKINRYPDSASYYLKKKLGGVLKVSEDSLIFGNGSDEIICLALRAFVGEGDEVVIARPTFLIYEIAAQVQGANVRSVALTKDLRYDLKEMKKAINSKTKLVFIANPDNPTGTYVTKKELDEFMHGLPERVIVFLDEAYSEFAAYSFKDYPNGIDYLRDPRIIVARSFSKVYGLAGLRIGYGIAGPEIIKYMERVREPFNINILAQVGALAALDDKAFLKRTMVHVEMEREFLYSAFRKMGLEYNRSATNFVIVNVGKDCKAVFGDLLKEGVIVRDMKAWGLDTFIRVTVGTKAENRKFVAALKRVLAHSD